MQTYAMLIGIDASRTVLAARTGTENYALHLIGGLVSSTSPHHFRLYFNTPPPAGLLSPSSHVSHKVMPWPRLWTHVRLSIELVCHRPDILYVPSHVLPLICQVPSVVTVHDLGYLIYPHTHQRFDRWYLAWSTRRHIRVATHIIADSKATRQDLIRYYRADPKRVTTVYPGLNPMFQPVQDPDRLSAVRARYHIRSDYVIHVGTLHPRKNIRRLLDAFDRIPDMQLVLAGKRGWLTDDILAKARAMGERVLLTGHVDQADLPALISGARVLAMPSLHEGFGFPVIEAMACGTPVVTSNVSSLPEVAGDAALLVDPQDTHALAEALRQVIEDERLRTDLRQRGLERARHFTWQTAAEETLAILERAACT